MLDFAGGVALGVNVADLLELERAFKRNGGSGAAAEIKHVARLGEVVARKLLDLRLERERFGQMPRHFDQRAHEALLIALGEHAAGAAGGDRKGRQRRELQVNALVEATPISGPARIGTTMSSTGRWSMSAH